MRDGQGLAIYLELRRLSNASSGISLLDTRMLIRASCIHLEVGPRIHPHETQTRDYALLAVLYRTIVYTGADRDDRTRYTLYDRMQSSGTPAHRTHAYK